LSKRAINRLTGYICINNIQYFGKLFQILTMRAEKKVFSQIIVKSVIDKFIFITSGATKVKGKVFPYSLPSVGPGADPGVQAVSPQVT